MNDKLKPLISQFVLRFTEVIKIKKNKSIEKDVFNCSSLFRIRNNCFTINLWWWMRTLQNENIDGKAESIKRQAVFSLSLFCFLLLHTSASGVIMTKSIDSIHHFRQWHYWRDRRDRRRRLIVHSTENADSGWKASWVLTSKTIGTIRQRSVSYSHPLQLNVSADC